VYIDPRPTPETIHLAYRQYYTHEDQVRLPAEQLRGLRWLQRVLANGYKNWKFGTDLQPSSRLGVLAAFLLPKYRTTLDRQFRQLPMRHGGGRVLDIGFGDGGFLDNARMLGWQVVGTDFDEKAVRNARERGIDARLGTVDVVDGQFDVITMSHVIEHLHDPVAVLRACYDLLAPGGTLWIETPNAAAVGLNRLGDGWLALDAPRHLVMFNRRSLERSLRDSGFAAVMDLPQPSPVIGLYAMSPRVREGSNPYARGPVPLSLRVESIFVWLFESLVKSRREYVAITARKPV
jgi:2-polyprenyl-3-methyl-5-hydroxy-6-metoxy-1,4-benzoquinol methylase